MAHRRIVFVMAGLLAGVAFAALGAAQAPARPAPTTADWAALAKLPDFTGVWEAGGGGGLKNADWDGTRATPTIDGDAIYTFGSTGDLVRRNLADGKLVWQLNVLKETNGQAAQWGTASSPLVDVEKVYVQAGIGDGAPVAVAVDKKTGKIAWQSQAKGSAGGGGESRTAGATAVPVAAEVVRRLAPLVGLRPTPATPLPRVEPRPQEGLRLVAN